MNRKREEKVIRYAIKKLGVGIVSVAVSAVIFMSGSVYANTDNLIEIQDKRDVTSVEVGHTASDGEQTVAIETEHSVATDTVQEPRVPIVENGEAVEETKVNSVETSESEQTRRTSPSKEPTHSSTTEPTNTQKTEEITQIPLTQEHLEMIRKGAIGFEGDQYDNSLLRVERLALEGDEDGDGIPNGKEIYLYEKHGKKYMGYHSHPLLADTDGDGLTDNQEAEDERLQWYVTDRDMIMFMELAYREDDYIKEVLDDSKPLTKVYRNRSEYLMMHHELAPYWKLKQSYHYANGFDAVLFETKSKLPFIQDGTVHVLAFRGTDEFADGDDIAAVTVGAQPKQGKDAEALIRQLALDSSITKLYLTGHSFGGYLVQRAAVEAYQLQTREEPTLRPSDQKRYQNFYKNVLRKGTTFNAPKVRTNHLQGSAFWQVGLDSKKLAQDGKLKHYIVDNDMVVRKNLSNDADIVENIGATDRGHSSRSYFEKALNDYVNFTIGKRNTVDSVGYQESKLSAVTFVKQIPQQNLKRRLPVTPAKSTTQQNPKRRLPLKTTTQQNLKQRIPVTPVKLTTQHTIKRRLPVKITK